MRKSGLYCKCGRRQKTAGETSVLGARGRRMGARDYCPQGETMRRRGREPTKNGRRLLNASGFGRGRLCADIFFHGQAAFAGLYLPWSGRVFRKPYAGGQTGTNNVERAVLLPRRKASPCRDIAAHVAGQVAPAAACGKNLENGFQRFPVAFAGASYFFCPGEKRLDASPLLIADECHAMFL